MAGFTRRPGGFDLASKVEEAESFAEDEKSEVPVEVEPLEEQTQETVEATTTYDNDMGDEVEEIGTEVVYDEGEEEPSDSYDDVQPQANLYQEPNEDIQKEETHEAMDNHSLEDMDGSPVFSGNGESSKDNAVKWIDTVLTLDGAIKRFEEDEDMDLVMSIIGDKTYENRSEFIYDISNISDGRWEAISSFEDIRNMPKIKTPFHLMRMDKSALYSLGNLLAALRGDKPHDPNQIDTIGVSQYIVEALSTNNDGSVFKAVQVVYEIVRTIREPK